MPQIEKNVPIPSVSQGEGITADLRQLSEADIGDSMFFPVPANTEPGKFSSRMTSYISKIGTGWATQRRESKEEITRRDPADELSEVPVKVEGIRVWKKANLPQPEGQSASGPDASAG